ncbi:uncharacterized protein DUF4124 [Alteromonadaceae bacterium 2753L.S.0a.02]|nr:uncharacterized protein DUF4124 [Alteromonadaceae bacterium 2753L.S.0a.02]
MAIERPVGHCFTLEYRVVFGVTCVTDVRTMGEIMRFLVWLIVLTAMPTVATAGVVKWTDEHGKVHYGDRVPEKYKEKAEQVEVDTTNVISNENKGASRVRSKKPSFPETKQQSQPSEMSQEEALEAMCAEAAKRYTELTTVRHTKDQYDSRSKTIESTVLVGKDGESYTRREQNRIAEDFRKDMNSKGCNIAPTKNMKL